MNATLIHAGTLSVLGPTALLLSLRAWAQHQRTQRRETRRVLYRAQLYSVRDGIRYRPPRRPHGATALRLLAVVNKQRRES